MTPSFDPHLYTQIGLDSGSLTMLGSIVHNLGEPGEYRVALHHGESVRGVCFITADKSSPVAQVTIDLAALADARGRVPGGGPQTGEDCGCCGTGDGGQDAGGKRYTVNPRGYALFRLSGGAGGYYVHVRRIDADVNDKGYDSRALREGDAFTAVVIRPGTYSVTNDLTRAAGRLVVSYPRVTDQPYVPPKPIRVACGPNALEPARLEVQPGQGIIFEAKAPSRIVIRLERPDDGPDGPRGPGRAGLRRPALT